jgi:protein-arginine kinase
MYLYVYNKQKNSLYFNRGIKTVQESVKAESGKDFQLSDKFGYIHSCPTNLGTGMRASVHVDLPGWTKEGLPALQARCEELSVQPRGTRGESGGQTGKLHLNNLLNL